LLVAIVTIIVVINIYLVFINFLIWSVLSCRGPFFYSEWLGLFCWPECP